MKKIMIAIFSILFICYVNLHAFEPGIYSYYTHWAYSGSKVVLSWNASEGATTYVVVAAHLETGHEYKVETTTMLFTQKWQPPKVGHYVFKVKAGNEHGWSDWAISTEDKYTLGPPWWLYLQMPPVTGIGLG